MNQHHLIVRFTSCTYHPVVLIVSNRFFAIRTLLSFVVVVVVVNYHAWAACGNESFYVANSFHAPLLCSLDLFEQFTSFLAYSIQDSG